MKFFRNSVLLFCGVLLGVFFCRIPVGVCGSAEAHGDLANMPPLLASLNLDQPLDFCGEPVPIAEQEVLERLEKEILLLLWDRPQVILWIKRAGRFFPDIEKALAKQGMPDDLKYVAVIESSLMVNAGSVKRAVGLWQFIKNTGRHYGLEINQDIDERRNVAASTAAAIRYFKELHGIFDSWTMAAAGYNMGEKRLQTALKDQGVNNYYYSYLPAETQRYIPRIVAVKLILANPTRYGFHLDKKDIYNPLALDRVTLSCPDNIPIKLVADAAGSYFKKIKDLNPEFEKNFIPKGKYNLSLPKGCGTEFSRRYPKMLAAWVEQNRKTTYVVRRGDSLSLIAERFNVPLSDLADWNNLGAREYIFPGDRLVVYR